MYYLLKYLKTESSRWNYYSNLFESPAWLHNRCHISIYCINKNVWKLWNTFSIILLIAARAHSYCWALMVKQSLSWKIRQMVCFAFFRCVITYWKNCPSNWWFQLHWPQWNCIHGVYTRRKFNLVPLNVEILQMALYLNEIWKTFLIRNCIVLALYGFGLPADC